MEEINITQISHDRDIRIARDILRYEVRHTGRLGYELWKIVSKEPPIGGFDYGAEGIEDGYKLWYIPLYSQSYSAIKLVLAHRKMPWRIDYSPIDDSFMAAVAMYVPPLDGSLGFDLRFFTRSAKKEAEALALAILEWHTFITTRVTREALAKFEAARDRMLREHTNIDPIIIRAQIQGIDGVMQELKEKLD